MVENLEKLGETDAEWLEALKALADNTAKAEAAKDDAEATASQAELTKNVPRCAKRRISSTRTRMATRNRWKGVGQIRAQQELPRANSNDRA